MKKIAVILILAAAFSSLIISPVQADALTAGQAGAYMNNSLKAAALPVWKITQDGTVDSVPWVDATNKRFAIYDPGTPADDTDDVVLDKETGLVWERYPSTMTYDWIDAIGIGYKKFLGGRMGWRLPTIEEIASLLVPTSPTKLPTDHPFLNVDTDPIFWSCTTNLESEVTDLAWAANVTVGLPVYVNKLSLRRVWCVRGGHGHDAY